jgi:hypothetical protein
MRLRTRKSKRFPTLFNYDKSIFFYYKTMKNYFMRNRFFISRRLRKAMNMIRIPWFKRS